MRNILVLGSFAFFGCNADTTKEVSSSSSDSTKIDNISYPYTATYSSKFEIGDANQSKIILDIWKNFDNNTLQNLSNSFADTVTLYFSDGQKLHGTREYVIAEIKKFRDQFTSVSSDVHAWIPVKATDKNENWVLVWGRETHTGKDGKKDSVNLQETWLLNKDNKVSLVYQFASKITPQ